MSDWNDVEAPKPKKKKKVWLFIVIAAVVLALAAGAVYFFLLREKPQDLLVNSVKETFSDFGILVEDLNSFQPDGKKSSFEMHLDVDDYGDEYKIGGAFACDGEKIQGSLDVDVEGVQVDLEAQLDEEVLKLNVAPFLNRTLVYNYTESVDGYLDDLADEFGLDIDDLGDGLKELYENMIAGGDTVEIDTDQLEKDLKERLGEIKFKKTKAKTVEVDGKDRKCKGYEFTMTAGDLTDLLEVAVDSLDDALDGGLDTLLKQSGIDEWLDYLGEEEDEATVRFYVYDGKLACLEVDDESDEISILFHGGDFRLQNVEFCSDGETAMLIKGKCKGDKETIEFVEVYDGEEYELASVIYDRDEEELTLDIDGEKTTIGLVAKKDRLEIRFDDLDLDGVEITGEICMNSNAELTSFKESKPFDVNHATEEEVSELIEEFMTSEPIAAAQEESNQKTDLANARALKSLVVASYMGDEDGYVYKTLSKLKKGETATFYLSWDGQEVSTDADDRMEITANWDGCKYGKYVCCRFDKDGKMVSSQPELPIG